MLGRDPYMRDCPCGSKHCTDHKQGTYRKLVKRAARKHANRLAFKIESKAY